MHLTLIEQVSRYMIVFSSQTACTSHTGEVDIYDSFMLSSVTSRHNTYMPYCHVLFPQDDAIEDIICGAWFFLSHMTLIRSLQRQCSCLWLREWSSNTWRTARLRPRRVCGTYCIIHGQILGSCITIPVHFYSNQFIGLSTVVSIN